MTFFNILPIIMVAVQMVEQMFAGMKGAGAQKADAVLQIVGVALKYPAIILRDVMKGDWRQLTKDISGVLVDIANQNGIFQHGGQQQGQQTQGQGQFPPTPVPVQVPSPAAGGPVGSGTVSPQLSAVHT